MGCLIYVFYPLPHDDFLRHVKFLEYKPLGGYAYMFPDSYFGQLDFNFYHFFDTIAGLSAQFIGVGSTVLLYEIVFSGLFFIAVFLNMRDPNKEIASDHFFYYLFFAFLLMSQALYFRLFLIRPCILLSIVFLFALRGREFVPGLAFAMIAGLFYYLFFLYTIPLALAHRVSGDRKFAYGLAFGSVLSFIGWLYLSDYQYLILLKHIASSLFHRGGISVVENNFSGGQLFQPVIFLFALLFVSAVYSSRRYDVVFFALLFTLPLAYQVRYFLDLTMPLLAIYAVNNGTALKSFFLFNRKAFEVFAMLSVFLIIPPLADRSIAGDKTVVMEKLKIERGKMVFVDSLPLNMSVIFWNKEPVKVIPSAEVAWNDPQSRQMLAKITRELSVDNSFCDYARGHQIDYLVTQHSVFADCLQHVRTFAKPARLISVWKYAPRTAPLVEPANSTALLTGR